MIQHVDVTISGSGFSGAALATHSDGYLLSIVADEGAESRAFYALGTPRAGRLRTFSVRRQAQSVAEHIAAAVEACPREVPQ